MFKCLLSGGGISPNFGENVPGTGEKTVRKRTNFSPVPGTLYDAPLPWDEPLALTTFDITSKLRGCPHSVHQIPRSA